MHALLCDTCGTPIRGEATEYQIVPGTSLPTQEGRARIALRGGQAQWLSLCGPCSNWVGEAIETLRHALQVSDR